MQAHDKDVTRVSERCHQGVVRGMDGGKFKRKLSEVNVRAVSRGQNELVCKFKMSIEIFRFCFRVCVCVPVYRDLFNFW